MSIDLYSDHAAIRTSTGLNARPEAGYSLLPYSSYPDTIEIKQNKLLDNRLITNISIPPSSSYHIIKVEDI